MPRSRQIGLTEDLKSKVLHLDRLTPEVRKNVTYDVRRIIEKELEDIEWLFSESPEAFKRLRDHRYYSPLEAVLPSDPKKALLTLEYIRILREALDRVESAVLAMGLRYMRSGR